MRRPSQFAPLLLSLLFIAHPSPPCIAADAPPPAPTSQPDPAADRLTFLTLQLSSIEASLNAVHSALLIAGYKSVASAGNAEYYAHNNTDLDRNGGGPISWDKFYGKTAKEFAPRDINGIPHNYQRPDQFDYMYKANNDQIARANADVANLSKKVDDLLTRRRQLDSEQSALWATISWESIQNHDIPYEALYRFQLKATASTPDSDARRDILRPTILFLRTIDKTVADDLDSLSTNQEATLADLKNRTQSAYAAARESLANAMDSTDLSPDDLKTAKQLLETLKRFPELSKNITDSYHLALDGDAAHDDNRKLTFRAQLQSALLDYAAATADLDYQLHTLSKSWGLEPQKGIANPDQLPANSPAITANTPAVTPPAAPSKSPVPTSSSFTFIGTPITSLTDMFGPNDAKQFQVDPDGTLTVVDSQKGFLFAGTTGKDFAVSGEMYMDSGDDNQIPTGIKPEGRVRLCVRTVSGAYWLNGKGIGTNRVVEGHALHRYQEISHFGQPDGQWLTFRFEVTAAGIRATVGTATGEIKGPLATDGKNYLMMAPGAKLRKLSLEIIQPPK